MPKHKGCSIARVDPYPENPSIQKLCCPADDAACQWAQSFRNNLLRFDAQ